MPPATNPPRAVRRKVPSGAPPYAGCTRCPHPTRTAMSPSALSRADSGGPTRARRNASSSVARATVVSAIRKKTNGATKPDGADGRSSAMTAASGRSAAPAAAAYQCQSVRGRVVATAAPQAVAPASSATEAARSSCQTSASRAALSWNRSPAAHTAPTAKPRATSGTRRADRGGPQRNPSGRRAASSATRAHAPAATGTAVPPARRWISGRRGRPHAVITREAASASRARAERSSELDMALAHPDRPRPEIYEQRTVGTEPAGAARRRRAQLPAPQPVTRREGRAFPLRERRLECADRDQRRHEPVQQVHAAHLWEALLERQIGPPDGRRHGVAHVDADAHGEPLEPISLPTALAQNAGDLAFVEEHVVWPLEPRPRRAEQSVNGVGDGQAGPDRHRSHHRMRGPEQHAEPDPSHGRMPGAAVATTAGGLLVGDHDRSRGRAVRAKVVDRVQCRAEPAKQPALRPAPAGGELRRRHTVER